ncbi:MAG: DUF6531 domain-containing protein [Chloroflexota bacterium]|nr:DUF6531 domain-containing protein [Chloroflexota bacterium]
MRKLFLAALIVPALLFRPVVDGGFAVRPDATPALASGSSSINLVGHWSVQAVVTGGPGTGSTIPCSFDVAQSGSTISWAGTCGGSTTNCSGVVDFLAGTMSVDCPTTPAGAMHINASIASDGQTAAGTWSGSNGSSGNYNATRVVPSGSQDGGAGRNQNTAYLKDPVDLATGTASHQHTDVAIPGRGVGLQFTRAYNGGAATTNGRLGFGWTDNYNAHLVVDASNPSMKKVTVFDETGGQDVFLQNPDGSYASPPGAFETLQEFGNGTFTLTRKDQTKLTFSAAGKLASLGDRNTNSTVLTYDGAGKLTSVADPGGRLLTFVYDASARIITVTDPLNRTVGYQYDAAGDLVTVTAVSSGTATFTYSNHLMTSLTDANGHQQMQDLYDTAGRVVEQTDAVGGVTCMYYGTAPSHTSANCPGVTPAPAANQTVSVDPRADKTTYTFDSAFRTTQIADALGNSTSYVYDSNNDLASVTDPLSHTTSFSYDDRGNVLSITDPLAHVQQYTYTTLNDVLMTNGPRTDVTDTTTYGYDGSGNLTTITDAFGKVTTLHYDDLVNKGSVTSIVEPDTAPPDPAGPHITTFTYDSYGNRATVKDALNNTTTTVFDLGGRVTSVTDAMTPSRTTLFSYDPQNHLLTVQDPYNGPTHKTIYTYDAVGNRKTVTNARGNTTTYDYDDKNRLITVTDPLLPAHRVTRYTYDANDNLATLKDAKQSTSFGGVVTYTYDAADRLKKIAYPDIHYYTDYTYDLVGRRLTMTDTRGRCDDVAPGCGANLTQSNTTTYVYDNANRLSTVQTTFSGTQLVQYGYDEANNRNSITYPDGKIASYTFDARNRMQTVGASWTAGITQYFYDDAGRLDYATLPATTGVTEDYGYDVADRLTSVTNTRAGPQTTLSFANYVLNPNGNRTQMTDGTGVTQYNYDVLDRLSSVTYPNAPTTTAYTYDGVGNRLTQQIDANPATTYTYDEADQLKTIGGVTNGYDLNGSLLTIGSGGGLAGTFLYDQENRLFRTGPCRADVNGSGSVNSTDQVSMGGHFGNEGSTKYDLNLDVNVDLQINSTDQLLAASEFSKICTGPAGNGRSWYDGDGLRVRQRTFTTTSPVVVDDDYAWDAGAGLPVVLQDTRTPRGQASATTTYLYGLGLISETSGAGVTSYYLADGLGSTTQLTDNAGAITDSYSYDVFGAPRTTTGTTANDFQYTGQQRDGNANRGLYYLRARSYDPALGRFLQKDPIPMLNRYPYVRNDPASLSDPAGLCGGGWNPSKYLDCPRKFIQNHPDVQRDIVLTADTIAIGFTGASAAITDAATIAGCSIGPEGCVVGYGLGIGATTGFRLLGNAASATSTIVGCIPPKEGASPGFAKDCGISFAGSFIGATFRDPNLGVGLDTYQFCRDLGKCP